MRDTYRTLVGKLNVMAGDNLAYFHEEFKPYIAQNYGLRDDDLCTPSKQQPVFHDTNSYSLQYLNFSKNIN